MEQEPNKKYKQYSEWIGKSSREYETEIFNLNKRIIKLEKEKASKWSSSLWEQIAHELVWAIGLLEENPTSPKEWRRMFNVLQAYENAVRTSHE